MAIVVGKTELILICLVAVALLALVARKIRVPYPILLTCGGVLLALVPGLPAIQLEPQLVFNLFLPPLLYPAAVFTSWRRFRNFGGRDCRHLLRLASSAHFERAHETASAAGLGNGRVHS